MKKGLLCYSGITILFILIVTPPILRIVLPDKEKEPKVVILKKSLLVCSNANYMTTTNYEGDKASIVMIKRMKKDNIEEINDNIDNTNSNSSEVDTNIEDNNISNDEQSKDNINENVEIDNGELDALFDDLSNSQGIELTNMDDGEVIRLDFSNNTFDIDSLTGSIDSQKAYYENMNMTCSIRE